MPDLTLSQVSEILQVSDMTVRRMLARGTFPHAYRLGPRLWRVPQADLDALRNGKPTRRKVKRKRK